MSLTEDIALLVSRTNALLATFDGKDASINAAVAAALAAPLSGSILLYVDPINGNDVNDGSAAHPVLTLDRALALTKGVAVAQIHLLGDVTLTARPIVYCQVLRIVGVRYQAGAANPYPEEKRTITPAAESGLEWDSTRSVPAIKFRGRVVLLAYVEVAIPTPPPAVVNLDVIDFAYGGSLVLSNVTVSAASAATTARLAGVWAPAQLVLAATATTITANAKGHVLSGVAANGDPNALWAYRSNLTSL